jgi:hypothetical protein
VVQCLSGAYADLPLDLWDELLKQVEITINIMTQYSQDTSKSAYEGLYGRKYDFKAYSLAPVGTLVLVHEKANERPTWSPHGKRGFYLDTIITSATQSLKELINMYSPPSTSIESPLSPVVPLVATPLASESIPSTASQEVATSLVRELIVSSAVQGVEKPLDPKQTVDIQRVFFILLNLKKNSFVRRKTDDMYKRLTPKMRLITMRQEIITNNFMK